jgi:hypothetical protein
MIGEENANGEKPQNDDPIASAVAPIDEASSHPPKSQEGAPKAGTADNPIHIRDPELGKWTRWLVIWTGALVFATVVSAVISYFQWGELQQSFAADRAYVFGSFGWDNKIGMSPDGTVNFTFTNLGRTPADLRLAGWRQVRIFS